MWDILSKHWILVTAVSITLIVLWIIAVLSKYIRLMLNIIRDSPPPLLMGPFDFERIEGRQVSFRAFDGTALRGMFLSGDSLRQHRQGSDAEAPAEDSGHRHEGYFNPHSRGVIIFCHEYGSDMYSCSRYCLPLLEAGFDIFTFDFRSHGQSTHLPGYSPRLWCTDKEISDCLGAMGFVHSQVEKSRLNINLGLFGISRGAGAALLSCQHPYSEEIVKAVIADSPFSTDSTLEWSMKKWVHIFARVRFVYEKHSPTFWRFLRWMLLKFARRRFHCTFPSVRKKLVKLRNIPIFFIHGQKDSYIRPEQTQMLFRLASPPRFLWIVPEAKHNQSVIAQPERYGAHTVAFFEKYLEEISCRHRATARAGQDEAWQFFAREDNICSPLPPIPNEFPYVDQNNRAVRRPQCQIPIKAVRKATAPLPECSGKSAVKNPTGQSEQRFRPTT